jgi:hypothetical protein
VLATGVALSAVLLSPHVRDAVHLGAEKSLAQAVSDVFIDEAVSLGHSKVTGHELFYAAAVVEAASEGFVDSPPSRTQVSWRTELHSLWSLSSCSRVRFPGRPSGIGELIVSSKVLSCASIGVEGSWYPGVKTTATTMPAVSRTEATRMLPEPRLLRRDIGSSGVFAKLSRELGKEATDCLDSF